MQAGHAPSIAISGAQCYHDVPMPARIYIALPAGRIFRVDTWFRKPSEGGGELGKSEIAKHMQCVDCRVVVAGVDVRSKSLTPPMSNACHPLSTNSSDGSEYKLGAAISSNVL